MKKFIKYFLLFTLIACCVAYIVCYATMKEQTVEFTNTVINFLNQPLPIIGVSILVLGAIIIKLLSMTKWGKSQIDKVNKELANGKTFLEESRKSLEKTENLLNERSDAKEQEIRDLKELIYKTIELNPNKKIKELLNFEIEKQSEKLKTQINEIVNDKSLLLEQKLAQLNSLKADAETLSGKYQEEVLDYLATERDRILDGVN